MLQMLALAAIRRPNEEAQVMKLWRICTLKGPTRWYVRASSYEDAVVEACRVLENDGNDIDVQCESGIVFG
jgi:hypothetical protein